MKIAFVIQDLFSQGAQYATAQMVRGFVVKGYAVDLIVSQYHDDIEKAGQLKPFAVPASVWWVHLRRHKARHNILELRRYLKMTDAVAVVAMSPNYSQALRYASIGLRKRPKIVHVEHGLAGMRDDYSIIEPVTKGSWAWRKTAWYWKGFDRVLTVSQFGKSDFERVHPYYPAERVAVVYNPVIGDAFFEKVCQPCQHPWLQKKRCFTFVTAGALETYKGHDTLLKAVAILKDEGVAARVVIFGKGTLRSDYQSFIDSHGLAELVDLAGYTNNFPAEARAADAFVLPSNLESFGIVLVEALAAGLPVVSTDAPFGPREVLENGRYGTLVPVKDPSALAEAMKAQIAKGRVAAPDESWRRFTVEAAVARYEKGMGL